jgi:hypothetical protein
VKNCQSVLCSRKKEAGKTHTGSVQNLSRSFK